MKREIKFRAFDPIGKAMYRVAMFCFEAKEVRIVNETCDVWMDMDEVILMQFTGLFDKNGREIYEGDIIKYHVMFYGKERAKKMIVEWKEDCETDLLCEPTFSGYLWSGYDYEIIGNIHDNPELLKEVNETKK